MLRIWAATSLAGVISFRNPSAFSFVSKAYIGFPGIQVGDCVFETFNIWEKPLLSYLGASWPTKGFLVENINATYFPLLSLELYVLFLVGRVLCFCFLKLTVIGSQWEGRFALGRSVRALQIIIERNVVLDFLRWVSGGSDSARVL